MNILEGRVIIITGGGRGIGREHALQFAARGAKIVVNDLGAGSDGSGSESGPAQSVVDEVVAAGGEAVANTDDVASSAGGDGVVATALDAFGTLHGLVNNAGILRDGMLFNMSDEDWETSIRVNLGGHFYPTRAAARYWRQASKAGNPAAASVVNTSSESGIFGNAGQSNYAAAKAGVAALTEVWNKELSRYGVRVNAVCPRGGTRLSGQVGHDSAIEDTNHPWHPGNVAPWVAYLLTADCPVAGQVFQVFGGSVKRAMPWSLDENWQLKKRERWDPVDLAKAVADEGVPTNVGRISPFD